jgi:hypothetical protein
MSKDRDVVVIIRGEDELTAALYKDVLNRLNAEKIGGIWDGTVYPHCEHCNHYTPWGGKDTLTLDGSGHTVQCAACQACLCIESGASKCIPEQHTN